MVDLKQWIPPALWHLIGSYLGQRIYFRGEYDDWNTALAVTGDGYAAPDILERVKTDTIALRAKRPKGHPASIGSSTDIPLPMVAAMLRAACMSEGKLCVLDYGGALGGTYFRCAPMLGNLSRVRWHVVEQPNFVTLGRELFENDVLTFHERHEECFAVSPPNAVLFSAVLQYLPEPWRILESAVSIEASVIVLDRTPIVALPTSRLTVQHVPARLGKASYPAWLFNRDDLLRGLARDYRCLCEFPAMDGEMMFGFRRVSFKGFILEKKADPSSVAPSVLQVLQ